MKKEINFDKIFMGKVRRIIDPIILVISKELDSAYYEHWKKGLDFNFLGFDRVETINGSNSIEENKKQFDMLHGTLFLIHELMIHHENMKLPIIDKIDEEKYNNIHLENNEVIKKSDNNISTLKQRKEYAIPLLEHLKNIYYDVNFFKDIESKL